VTNLLNGITHKSSYEKLNELFKSDAKAFVEPKLVLKLFAILTTYKYKQPLRRYILFLLENALSNQDILDSVQNMIASIGLEVF
jgi:hypothetical protein